VNLVPRPRTIAQGDHTTVSTASLETQLEQLLSEPLAAIIQREQDAFDQLTAPHGDELVLFGAGGLGKRTLSGLRRLGIEPLAFADSNPALWGTSIDGVSVMSPQSAADR
jgi:FlaA1/EpsC-like NDP-sugar epimerase